MKKWQIFHRPFHLIKEFGIDNCVRKLGDNHTDIFKKLWKNNNDLIF